MSLQANFAEWCRLNGLKPVRAVYLDDDLWSFDNGEARIVRTVDTRKRAGNRTPQAYVVEVMVNNDVTYPFGAHPMGKKELLRRLIRSTMEESA